MNPEFKIPWYRRLSIRILLILMLMFVFLMVSHHVLITNTFKARMNLLKPVIRSRIVDSGKEIVDNLQNLGEMFLQLNTQKIFHQLCSYMSRDPAAAEIRKPEDLVNYILNDKGARDILAERFLKYGYCTASVYDSGKLLLAYHPKTSLQGSDLFEVIKNLDDEAKKKQNIEKFAAHWSLRQSGIILFEQTGTFLPENIPEGWREKISYQFWGNFNGIEFVVEISAYLKEFSEEIEKVLVKQRRIESYFEQEAVATNALFLDFFLYISLIFLAGIIIFYIYLRRMIVHPIKKIVLSLKKFSREEFEEPMNVSTSDEFKIIEENSNMMVERLSSTLEKFERLNAELETKVQERTSELEDANRELEHAREKSEKLLMNILPQSIARRLMENPEVVIADDFAQVTVLFTDFKGFTPLSETIPPEKLVRELNEIFAEFDEFCRLYGMEKIKTIGDAYMAAGGLPVKNDTHPSDAVKLGLEIIRYIGRRSATPGKLALNIRVGIHSGPVIAGVIGKTKFSYDLWGDTVNIASRMESSGSPGKVTMSENTYKLVKDQFQCECRGDIEIKGKGKMKIFELSQV